MTACAADKAIACEGLLKAAMMAEGLLEDEGASSGIDKRCGDVSPFG